MYLWAKYGTQTDIRFGIVKRGVVDLAATADWTPATGDTKVSKDGGNYANSTNNPAAVGGTGSVGWKVTLSATELQCAELNLQIVDSATKAVEDQFLTVYTYGHASAKIQADLSDIVRLGLTALPNAAANAAGGLVISTAGGVDMDDLAADVDATETRVILALPNAAPQAAGGLITSTAGSLDMDDLAADADAAETATTAAAIRTALGLAAANVDTQLAAIKAETAEIDAIVDLLPNAGALTDLAAIKAKTDQLIFTLANKLDSNVLAVSGETDAADMLEALMDGNIVAQVNDGSATTTVFKGDGFTETTNDHFKGRLITFISGALLGQQTAITAYAGATQSFTVTAMTEAPADNDYFVIT